MAFLLRRHEARLVPTLPRPGRPRRDAGTDRKRSAPPATVTFFNVALARAAARSLNLARNSRFEKGR
jgi:hypothetical protein